MPVVVVIVEKETGVPTGIPWATLVTVFAVVWNVTGATGVNAVLVTHIPTASDDVFACVTTLLPVVAPEVVFEITGAIAAPKLPEIVMV